jgi:hypothetical protein
MKNNEYPTWLVPLDIAKKLKAIGFNEYCYFYWDNHLNLVDCYNNENGYPDLEGYNSNKHQCKCSLPTWTEVFAWFRERGYLYAIENEICYDFKTRTQPPKIKYTSYFETVGSGVKIHSCTSESYEEAREELVRDLIYIYSEELLE